MPRNWNQPHLIEWTFSGQRFRFELRAHGQGCSLAFTHVFDDRAIAAQRAAGWECYFDRLEAHLSGEHRSEQRAHESIGERHERDATRFALDPTPGRKFIVTALDFRGFAVDEGGGPLLRLERRYDQPVERVWRALTDPAERQHWLPGELEIIESDAPRRSVGSWQGKEHCASSCGRKAKGVRSSSPTPLPTATKQRWLPPAGTAACTLDALFAEHMMSEADSLRAWPDVHERLAKTWNIDPEIGRKPTRNVRVNVDGPPTAIMKGCRR